MNVQNTEQRSLIERPGKVVCVNNLQPTSHSNLYTEDAVSSSTIRLLLHNVHSNELLSPNSLPVEALAAVHYFASSIAKPPEVSAHNGIRL